MPPEREYLPLQWLQACQCTAVEEMQCAIQELPHELQRKADNVSNSVTTDTRCTGWLTNARVGDVIADGHRSLSGGRAGLLSICHAQLMYPNTAWSGNDCCPCMTLRTADHAILCVARSVL